MSDGNMNDGKKAGRPVCSVEKRVVRAIVRQQDVSIVKWGRNLIENNKAPGLAELIEVEKVDRATYMRIFRDAGVDYKTGMEILTESKMLEVDAMGNIKLSKTADNFNAVDNIADNNFIAGNNFNVPVLPALSVTYGLPVGEQFQADNLRTMGQVESNAINIPTLEVDAMGNIIKLSKAVAVDNSLKQFEQSDDNFNMPAMKSGTYGLPVGEHFDPVASALLETDVQMVLGQAPGLLHNIGGQGWDKENVRVCF